MSDTKQQLYWNKHFLQQFNPNQPYFDWYAERRLVLFGPPPRGRSIEIGAGGGEFAAMAGVAVVLDLAEVAVRQARDHADTFGVVADAASLPFGDQSFQAIYLNDVVHHLKNDHSLRTVFDEFYRILAPDGYLHVSDRKPTLYNRFLLMLGAPARAGLIFFSRLLGREVRLSGGDQEPPMTKDDWDQVSHHFEIVAAHHWKNAFVFWLFSIQQAANIFLPMRLAFKTASALLWCCRRVECHSPNFMMSDLCLVLWKKPLSQ